MRQRMFIWLRTIITNIVGKGPEQEIIVYCGVGGYASPMYFVLKEDLRYVNVKYNGFTQEWTSDMALPIVYKDIGSEYLSLQNLYGSLSQMLSSLQISYTTAESDYIALKGEYNKLKGRYGISRRSIIGLKANIVGLKANVEGLGAIIRN